MSETKSDEPSLPPKLLNAIRNEVKNSTEQQFNDIWMVVHSIKDAGGASSGETPVPVAMPSGELRDFKKELSDLKSALEDLKRSQVDQTSDIDKKMRGMRKRISLNQSVEKAPAADTSELKGRLDRAERDASQGMNAAAALETRLYDVETRVLRRLEVLEARQTSAPGTPADPLSDEVLMSQPAGVNFYLDDLVKVVLNHNAQDLHLKADSLPQTCLHGHLIPIGKQTVGETDCRRLILLAMPHERRKELYANRWVDCLVTIHDTRFRLCAFFERDRLTGTLRMLNSSVLSPEELRLPRAVEVLSLESGGLLVVASLPQNGRSTTMASLVEVINRQRKVRIFYLDDQQEYELADGEALISQQEVGSDVPSMAEGIRKVKKLSPDVVVVSEVPDGESWLTLLELASSKTLVIAGTTSERAASALESIVESVAPHLRSLAQEKIQRHLRGVLAQKLVPRKDGDGQLLATELLLNTPATSDFLREGHYRLCEPLLERSGHGMHSMQQSLSELAREGLIPESLVGSPPQTSRRERTPFPPPDPGALKNPPRLEPPPLEPPPFEEPPLPPLPKAVSVGRPVMAAPPPQTESEDQTHKPAPPPPVAASPPLPAAAPVPAPAPPKDSKGGEDEALLGWL